MWLYVVRGRNTTAVRIHQVRFVNIYAGSSYAGTSMKEDAMKKAATVTVLAFAIGIGLLLAFNP